MTNKEAIDRWATYIVPAVFKAEKEATDGNED